MNKKLLLSPLLISSLFAMDKNFIELGAGFMKTNDNFSTNAESKISSYNNDKEESNAIPYISFNYTKDLNKEQNFYLDMGIKGLLVGSELHTKKGTFNFGLKGGFIGEEWENPFLLNTKREKTKTNELGAFVSYGLELTQYISPKVTYAYSKKNYEKETLADELKREGNRHILELENFSFINKSNFLLSKFSFENYDAKGKISAYNDYGLELTYIHSFSQKTQLVLITNLNKKEYKKTNTIFNKKINEDSYGLITAFKYKKPFHIKNTFVSLKAGINKTSSNENFYEKNENFSILSVGYKF